MDRCVVRQAIKEKETGKITGYELIFQGGRIACITIMRLQPQIRSRIFLWLTAQRL